MKKSIITISVLLFFYSCKKNNSDPNPTSSSNKPTAAQLIFPYENSLCNMGTDITPTESTVLFEWERGTNVDNFELVLKNLLTGTFNSYNTNATEIPIVILRNTPYKWYIISKSNSVSDTSHSASWKFFNAGAAILSYAPFPADIVFPAMASTISTTSSSITLDWNGNDIDNDIIAYDVYFGTSTTPGILQSDVTVSTLNNVPITTNTIYYWKIITKDSGGNQSASDIAQFKIL